MPMSTSTSTPPMIMSQLCDALILRGNEEDRLICRNALKELDLLDTTVDSFCALGGAMARMLLQDVMIAPSYSCSDGSNDLVNQLVGFAFDVVRKRDGTSQAPARLQVKVIV